MIGGRHAPDAVTPAITGLAILVVGGLVALSLGSLPQPDMPGPLEQLPHVVAYAAATFVLLSVIDRRRDLGRATIGLVAASMVIVGSVLEVAQRAVKRDVEIVDVVANSLGVLIAVGLFGVARRFWRVAPPRDR